MDDGATAEQQLCSDMPGVPEGEEEANEVSDDEQKGGSDIEIGEGSSEDFEGDDSGSLDEEFLEEMEMFGEDGDVLLSSYD
jgi:hypothetical protein